MSLKIGVLCTYSFPEGMAPTMRILSYGKGLVENGCNVEVIIFQPKVQESLENISGAINDVKYVYSHVRSSYKSRLYKLLIDRPKSLINAVKILYKSHRKCEYDCVLLSFDSPLYLLFFAPILKLCGIHLGFIGDEFPEPIRKLKSKIPFHYTMIYRFVYLFISFRVLMTDTLKEFYNKIITKPTYILCSVIDETRFQNLVQIPSSRRYLCYMGNMMLAKDNVDNIVRAFNLIKDEYPDMDLHLYGTPNDSDKQLIQSLISQLMLDDRVYFMGRTDYDNVPNILHNATILVTSQPDTKRACGGFPTKLAEYMMSGTPAIVTDVGEIHLYVQDGDTIYMVPPQNELAYANKLSYILKHPDEALGVATRAYEFAVSNFGAKDVTKPLIDFIKSV